MIEWCVRGVNSDGIISWYKKDEGSEMNDWVSNIEEANVYTCQEAMELATSISCTLGRGTYSAKRKCYRKEV